MTKSSSMNKQRLVDAACRTYFLSFARQFFRLLNPGTQYYPGWHWRALGYRLEQVWRGEEKRLIINIPPRCGKSFLTSVAFPAWVLGCDPTKRLVVISYNAELAAKLSNDFRALVESPRYQRLFPCLRISRNTELEVATDQYGYRRATSMDGTLTGIGGDIIIIDDYLKPADAVYDNKRTAANKWFFDTVLSRLDNKLTGAVIVVGQRLHMDDLFATLLRPPGEWTPLSWPAIAEEDERIPIGNNEYHLRRAGDLLHPQLMSQEFLQSLRNASPETYAAQYQQNPLPPGGALIKPEWIRYYDQLPQLTSSPLFVQSWDAALKPGEPNSRSACTTWLFQNENYYLVDLFVGQLDYWDLKQKAISLAHQYKPAAILIEDTGLGAAMADEFQRLELPALPVTPKEDKKTRMAMHIPKFADGRVFFPKQKPWCAEAVRELLDFPGGRRTDIVDSMSQALAYKANAFDAVKFFDGMARLHSGLVFQQMFRGRVV
jgi:predicted phage terminase large subunit-like protein